MPWTLSGNIRGPQGAPGAAVPPLSSRLTAAANSTVVTYAGTGLTVTLAAGKVYEVKAFGHYRTAATTTGIGLRLGGTVVPAAVRYSTVIWNASTPTIAQATALSTALLSTGVTAAATDYTWEIRGLIRVTTAGTLTVDYASEVAASAATIQPESYLLAQEIA